MMLPDKLRDLLPTNNDYCALINTARSYVNAHEGETDFTPHLFIMSRQTPTQPIQLTYVCLAMGDAWNQWEARASVLRTLGHKFHSERHEIPVAIAMVSEAWMSVVPADESRSAPRPSKDPNRQEVIILDALTLDRRGAIDIRPFKRVDGVITMGDWTGQEEANEASHHALLLEFFAGLMLSLQGRKEELIVDPPSRKLDL
jgi:hypothetical protein